ncbi:hypothetical protein ACIBBB_34815 [Streptomyces sp. NPDC051217]|uniref:hypothetical protein n=1 Tax=Streptomyces sp. NPDC051217 TaxID=3365644 RepID=UPI003789BDA5
MTDRGAATVGRRRAVVAALLAVGLVGACQSSTGSPRPDRPDTGTGITLTQGLTEQEKDLLHEAEQKLTQSCMRERGFRMWITPRWPIPQDRDFPYGVHDARWASVHGYGSAFIAQRETLRTSDPNRRYFSSLSAADRQRAVDALHGRKTAERLEVVTPGGVSVGRFDDGCTAQAQRTLYGDLNAWFTASTLAQALDEQRRRQVVNDKAFTKAVTTWSHCMRTRGFAYDSPDQARAAFMDNSRAGTAPGRKEIRTATAEARCADLTGLSSTTRRLDERYGEQTRKAHPSVYRTKSQLEHDALTRARTLAGTA